MMPFVVGLAMNLCEYSRRHRVNRGNIRPMKTLREMLAEARQVVPEEGPEDLQRRLKSGTPPVVIDVRDPDEYRDGHIEAATNISRGFLEFRIGGTVSDPSTPVVLYCQTGLRSVLAAKALKELGYQNVINLQGGYAKWAQSGLPVVKDIPMTPDQIQRYSRHFLLAQVGDKGQRRLLRSKVLLIGAGGLGSPTALYLAAAGVGTLGVMDGDVVDVSNLQRQILHTTADVGKPKVESAPRTIGVVQATEAVKLILGIGDPLIGRLLTYDALGMRFREVRLRRDPKCPLCGNAPTITDLSIHREGSAACEVTHEPAK